MPNALYFLPMKKGVIDPLSLVDGFSCKERLRLLPRRAVTQIRGPPQGRDVYWASQGMKKYLVKEFARAGIDVLYPHYCLGEAEDASSCQEAGA
jgi:hypothetical protein